MTKQWYPIKTAPRDGTKILSYEYEHGLDVENIEPVFWKDGAWHYALYDAFEPDPTHWRPLPGPPSKENKLIKLFKECVQLFFAGIVVGLGIGLINYLLGLTT